VGADGVCGVIRTMFYRFIGERNEDRSGSTGSRDDVHDSKLGLVLGLNRCGRKHWSGAGTSEGRAPVIFPSRRRPDTVHFPVRRLFGPYT
jgi:hypothetical protein